jgi:hypothetical protein
LKSSLLFKFFSAFTVMILLQFLIAPTLKNAVSMNRVLLVAIAIVYASCSVYMLIISIKVILVYFLNSRY